MENSKYQPLYMFRYFFTLLLFLALLLFTENVQAQKMNKKNLTEQDYSLWTTMVLEAISDDGQWVSYRKYYDAADTLFVTHRKSKQRFTFNQVYEGSFKNEYYLCGTSDGVFRIVSLESGKVKALTDVQKFTAYHSFIILQKNVASQTITSIINYDGHEYPFAFQV